MKQKNNAMVFYRVPKVLKEPPAHQELMANRYVYIQSMNSFCCGITENCYTKLKTKTMTQNFSQCMYAPPIIGVCNRSEQIGKKM